MNLQTLGQHIRQKRVALKILQSDVAKLLEVSEDTITNWENRRSEPQINFYPKIVQFLGYSPFTLTDDTLGGRIKKYRTENGLSHKKMGKMLGVNATTVGSWEQNITSPSSKNSKKIKEFII